MHSSTIIGEALRSYEFDVAIVGELSAPELRFDGALEPRALQMIDLEALRGRRRSA